MRNDIGILVVIGFLFLIGSGLVYWLWVSFMQALEGYHG
jgi:hypothetical protein